LALRVQCPGLSHALVHLIDAHFGESGLAEHNRVAPFWKAIQRVSSLRRSRGATNEAGILMNRFDHRALDARPFRIGHGTVQSRAVQLTENKPRQKKSGYYNSRE